MSQQNTFSSARKIIGYVSLALLFFVVVGLFSVNFIAGFGVIAGAIVYFLLVKFLKFIGGKSLLLLAFIATSCLVFLSVFLFSRGFLLPPLPPQCPISYYRIVASPQTNQLKSIKIQEFVVLRENTSFTPPSSWMPTYVDNQTGFQLPEKVATIEQKGFLLKEVSFQSSISCSSSTFVELNDFPLNSFFAAHYARDLQKYPYVGTETITWNSSFENVRFSYITPPFQMVKPILNPLVGASSVNQWFMGFVGIIGAVIFTPFIKPVLAEIAQKSIKNKISNADVQTKQTVKLIVSEKGEEKEIEVKKKH